MRIRIITGPQRRKPRVGDTKTVRGITYVRQWRRATCGALMVRDGRPVFEWVRA